MKPIDTHEKKHAPQRVKSYSKVKIVKPDGIEHVFCMSVPDTSNFISNGIVSHNCDSLRYCIFSAFPTGEFNNPDENLTIEQLRRKVYGEPNQFLTPATDGYY